MFGRAQRQKDQAMIGVRVCKSKTGETILWKNTDEARKLAKTLADIEEKKLQWKIHHKLEMREARRQLFVARAVASRRALTMLEALPKADGSSMDKQNRISGSLDGKEKRDELENELEERQNANHRISSGQKSDKLFVRRKEVPNLEGPNPSDGGTFPSLADKDKPREEDKPTDLEQCSLPRITRMPCITFTSLEVINEGQPSCIRAMSQMYKKKERKNATAPLLTTTTPLVCTRDNCKRTVDQYTQQSKLKVKTTAQTKPLPSRTTERNQSRQQSVEEINKAVKSLRKMSEKLKEKTKLAEIVKTRETIPTDTEYNGKIDLGSTAKSTEVSEDLVKVRTSSFSSKNAVEHVMAQSPPESDSTHAQSSTNGWQNNVNVANFAIVYGCSRGLQRVEIKEKPPKTAILENGSEKLERKKSFKSVQEQEGGSAGVSETEEKLPPLPLRRHGNFSWRDAVKRLTAASRFVRHLRPGNRPQRSLYPEDNKYRVTITGFGPAMLVTKSVPSPITDPRFVNLQSSLVSTRAASTSPEGSEELEAHTETSESSHTNLNADL